MNGTGVSPEECKYLEISERKNLKEYKMYFGSIGEVQSFLLSDPDINTDVFYELKSKTASDSFAGAPLSDAINYLIGGYSENYDQFLELAKQLEQVNKKNAKVRKTTTSFVGQRPNVPAYIAGAPKNMYRLERTEEKKLKRIWMKVTYESSTTEQQIRHRGIIALNLIKLLEMNNYMVDFRLFEVCSVDSEVFRCEIELKKPGERLFPRLCYYPMCGKAFVRRVLCRIKESMPFKCGWGLSYGVVLNEQYTRMIMDIQDNDIYIGSPSEMGINGENIYVDADTFLNKIGIADKIVIPVYTDEGINVT
jgi:hypothetical protein